MREDAGLISGGKERETIKYSESEREEEVEETLHEVQTGEGESPS